MTLDENDYLTFQLYTASKTPRIRNTRIRSWIVTTVAFLSLAYAFFVSNNGFLGYYFLIAAVLSLVLYRRYSGWRYKRHYRRHIQDTYKNRFGEECILEITEDAIFTKDKTGETRINTTEIEEINEITDFYFIKTKSGTSLIISKLKTDPAELDRIKSELKALAGNKGVKHNVELDWKWR
jgi:hypothetical protein